MKISKLLSVGLVVFAVLFGIVHAETAAELQSQTQVHERIGPIENQPSSGEKAKLYQKQ